MEEDEVELGDDIEHERDDETGEEVRNVNLGGESRVMGGGDPGY